MPSSESDRERWLDQELKGVPLPEGLIARLKEICAGDDMVLDAAICDVHVPEGLRTKLKNIPADRKLDRAMRNVAVPADLADRLKAIPGNSTTSTAAGAACSAPEAARDGVARPARRFLRQWYRSPIVRAAIAASILTAIGMVGLGTLGSLLRTADRTDPQADAPPSDVAAPFGQESSDRIARQPAATSDAVILDDMEVVTPPDDAVAAESGTPTPESLAATPATKAVEVAAPVDVPFSPTVPGQAADHRVFVTDNGDETVPDLERVEGLVPRGVAPPLVKQYPRMRLIKDGVHPFVSPAVNQALRTIRVPLVTRPRSYYILRNSLRENRLPPAEEIRPEGFLAGVDYQFPRPSTLALGIRTAAGPSPFGARTMQLLQVGVQASNGPPRTKEGTALTLAVDISASMAHGNRLTMVRRALTDLVHQFGPRDRLSLVAFSQRADVLIAQAGRDRMEGLVAAIQQLRTGDTADLAAGLQAASDVAMGTQLDKGVTGRLVLLTDHVGYLPASVLVPLEELAARTAAAGVRLDVVEVGYEALGDPRLRELARSGGGRMKSAHNLEEIHDALSEILTGKSPLLATGVRLTVQFNPKVVAEYRLLGHEADMVGGLLPGSLKASFNVGETATALFELRLNSLGGDNVAVADLRWQDAETGEKHSLMQRISRVQFATTLVEAPLSLQMAAIAAESAEVLRGSVYAPNDPAALGQVLEVAGTLHPRVYENPSFVEFLMTIEEAHRLRTAKSTPRSRQPDWLWRLHRR